MRVYKILRIKNILKNPWNCLEHKTIFLHFKFSLKIPNGFLVKAWQGYDSD